jgi:hypothetical protein
MSEPIGELDPDILARARAKAHSRGERLEDVIERRMREYIDDESETVQPG